jgi:hypothetical protein
MNEQKLQCHVLNWKDSDWYELYVCLAVKMESGIHKMSTVKIYILSLSLATRSIQVCITGQLQIALMIFTLCEQ